MELRYRFNEDEENYDRYRPDYPPELFADVLAYSAVTGESCLLEIGPGTGQATRPFLQAGCRVAAVELGDRLSAFLADKFREFPNFSVTCGDFMETPVEPRSLDLIYSATAFHWLPREEALAKVRQSLRSGGTLALFWNHPFTNRRDDPGNAASEVVYRRFRPTDREPVEFSQADCAPWIAALEEAGFRQVETKLYRRVRALSTEDYLHLLNTYSDHRSLEPEVKAAFEKAMREAVDGAGGILRIYDTVDLYLAREP